MDLQRAMTILTLARLNKPEEITALVKSGIPVDFCNQMGQTALHIASLWGNIESMRALLQLGADANMLNSRGTTPLHFAAAAKERAKEAVQVLLDAGAEPQVVDMSGRMPHECAELTDVRMLLGGPDPRLFEFCEEGRAEDLRALLKDGAIASLKVIDSEGRCPLNLAAASGNVDTLKVLLEHDKTALQMPDAAGNSVLHAAVQADNPDMLRYVVTLGADINEQNLNESEYASGSWGVKGDALPPSDKTALHLAVEEGKAEFVEVLLQAGADPNIPDFDSRSALHLALEVGDEEIATLLLQHGADPNLRSKDFTSPLHFATQSGSTSLLRLLLERGATVSVANDGGWAPLHLAARAGKADKVTALIGGGSDVNAVNAQGNTPLHLGAANGHVEVCRLLLNAGADVALTNKDGKKPVDMTSKDEVKQLFEARQQS